MSGVGKNRMTIPHAPADVVVMHMRVEDGLHRFTSDAELIHRSGHEPDSHPRRHVGSGLPETGVDHDRPISVGDQMTTEVHPHLALVVSGVETPVPLRRLIVIPVGVTPVETVLDDKKCVDAAVEFPGHELMLADRKRSGLKEHRPTPTRSRPLGDEERSESPAPSPARPMSRSSCR